MNFAKMLPLILAMSVAEQAHLGAMPPDDAEAFLGKSAPERAAILKALDDTNPVVFKGEKTGIEVRKNDGDVAKRLAEKAELQATALEKAETQVATEKAARELVELTKRAGETIGALAGETGAHIALLGAVESIADVAKRDAAIVTLKAANAAMKAAGKAKGAGGITEPTGFDKKSAYDALEKGLTAFAKANNVPTSKLWTEALDGFVKTPEGAELQAAYDTARTVSN